MSEDPEADRATAAGTLYLVGTPIGNLEDITLRAIRVLREVSAIAAEDTRRTRALLTHFGIHGRIMSYREHNRESAGRRILEILRGGKSVAVVSDAGMPGLSDPGCELVSRCHDEGIRVTPVPGPSAAIAALVSSGLCKQRFVFEGFLPRARTRRLEILRGLENDPRPSVIYEAPGRVARTIEEIAETLGPRSVVVARELTKVHEEIIRAPAPEAARAVGPSPLGEFVIVVAGAGPSKGPGRAKDADFGGLVEQVRRLEESGLSRMEAIKSVARTAGLRKRDVYRELERLKKGRR